MAAAGPHLESMRLLGSPYDPPEPLIASDREGPGSFVRTIRSAPEITDPSIVKRLPVY